MVFYVVEGGRYDEQDVATRAVDSSISTGKQDKNSGIRMAGLHLRIKADC